MRIRMGEDQPIVKKHGGYPQFIARLLWERWQTKPVWSVAGTVHAEIHRSSWVAACPFCAGVQIVQIGVPFICVDCVNQANNFQALAVVFPANASEIEQVLLKRPDPNTRNYLSGETLADLKQQNREHGHEV